MTGGAGNGKRYFSHDSDAFFDSRIVKMRTRLGVAGYGAYWMIVERLRTSEGYKHECDYEVFACLANADAELFRAVVEDHGLFEFVENDGKRYFYSESLIRRMMKMEDIIEKRREAGRKGAEARWQTDDNADPLPEQENDTNVASAIANAKQVLSDCHSTALAKNGKLNKTKLNKTKDKHIMVESDATKTSKVTQSDQFDQFWAIYPKKVGKKAALNIWTRLKPDKDLLEQILRAVEKQKKLDQWTKDGGQFIPNPATWLNQCRWEDELPKGNGQSRTVIGKYARDNRYHAPEEPDDGEVRDVAYYQNLTKKIREQEAANARKQS